VRFAKLAFWMCLAGPAAADDLLVVFQDSSPKDRLIIYNAGCAIGAATFQLDLTPTLKGLYLDTTDAAPGTGVSHQLEIIEGAATTAPAEDGDQILAISLQALPELGAVTITMDVDDTNSDAEIIVLGAEISGATIKMTTATTTQTAVFANDGRAFLPVPDDERDCLLS
jgi:hypothetical protein